MGHNITQLMSCVHGPAVDLRIKTPDVRISLLQGDYEVKVDEHNSLLESGYVWLSPMIS